MGNNDSGGMTMIALVVGALLVLVVGLYAGGVFSPKRSETASVTIETPAETPAPTPAPATPPGN